MCEIKYTIKLTFGNGCEKPNLGEIVNFAKALDGDPNQILAVYRIAEEKAIFVKFHSEEAMLHALHFNAEELTFHYANGKEAKVRMSNAGEFVEYVRVYDLPPEVSDLEISAVLGKYGSVKRVVREKFPADLCFDAYTGVRGVYMDVKKEIPNSLHFLNRKGNVFYSGNKDRCFVCKAEGHKMDSCPKRKARKENQNGDQSGKQSDKPSSEQKGEQSGEQEGERSGGQSSEKTYAGVVTGDTPSSNEKQQTDSYPEEMQEEDGGETDDEISEEEPHASYKDNPFYKIALEFKRRQDEEKEKKRLQERKELREREKAKARKKSFK